MRFPGMAGAACNDCKTMAVGGSYVVNATTKQPQQAVAFLNSMATPAMGNRWLEAVLVQTGIKADPSKIGGPHAAYFRDLAAVNAGAKYFFGLPSQVMTGQAQGGVHAGFQQRVPGRHDQRRRRDQADERGLRQVILPGVRRTPAIADQRA